MKVEPSLMRSTISETKTHLLPFIALGSSYIKIQQKSDRL